MHPAQRRRILPAVLCALILAATASPTFAARQEEEREVVDARLEGYGNNVNVTLPSGSSGTTWMLFVVLAILASAGLFKDARRSHLD